jgi:hypothetical protein
MARAPRSMTEIEGDRRFKLLGTHPLKDIQSSYQVGFVAELKLSHRLTERHLSRINVIHGF